MSRNPQGSIEDGNLGTEDDKPEGNNTMEYRVRESSHGGWVVEVGCTHEGGVRVGAAGITMKAFIVYESRRFDTEKQARNFIKRYGY